MKHYLPYLIAAVLASGCGKSTSDGHQHDDAVSDSTSANEALYNQVMAIHDEVMPKSSDILRLKKKLQDQIASTPDMVVEERKKLEQRIAALDSADKMMWDWMHEFNPLPDSADQEAARAYLESEMERIRKVREAMLEVLRKEQGAN